MKLFISYAHVDKPIVKSWIVETLVAGGHDVWFDAQLIAGQNWESQLYNAIASSDALVYAISPESNASEWCLWELQQALALNKPIIPVLIQARTPMPSILDDLKLQFVDFSDGATADAVARLMGGLQQTPADAKPAAPSSVPSGTPPQAINNSPMTQAKDNNVSEKSSGISKETVGLMIAFASLVVAIIALIPMFTGDDTPASLPDTSEIRSTPSTPIAVALRDLDIRSGPHSEFERIDILPVESSRDILGINPERLWYQILLNDGNRGWILAAESGARFEGNRDVLRVIDPTNTHTPMPTNTPLPATATPLPTNTPLPTSTPLPTNTSLPAPTTAPATATSAPIVIATYPCDAQVDPFSTSTTLNVVRQFPNQTSTTVASVRRGDAVTVIEKSAGNDVFYRIQSNGRTLGWIAEEHLELSANCPS